MAYDLILKGGRVIDPSQSIDRVTDVAFSGGKVAKVGDNLGEATEVRDVKGY
ncbi:MAG: dihydroorotase, partial [Hyphomicrobiales bacterium]|nr:dihydroorotase [Hyphomicrobiales bacterium]